MSSATQRDLPEERMSNRDELSDAEALEAFERHLDATLFPSISEDCSGTFKQAFTQKLKGVDLSNARYGIRMKKMFTGNGRSIALSVEVICNYGVQNENETTMPAVLKLNIDPNDEASVFSFAKEIDVLRYLISQGRVGIHREVPPLLGPKSAMQSGPHEKMQVDPDKTQYILMFDGGDALNSIYEYTSFKPSKLNKRLSLSVEEQNRIKDELAIDVEKMASALTKVTSSGVIPTDIKLSNALKHRKSGNITLIDFAEAVVHPEALANMSDAKETDFYSYVMAYTSFIAPLPKESESDYNPSYENSQVYAMNCFAAMLVYNFLDRLPYKFHYDHNYEDVDTNSAAAFFIDNMTRQQHTEYLEFGSTAVDYGIHSPYTISADLQMLCDEHEILQDWVNNTLGPNPSKYIKDHVVDFTEMTNDFFKIVESMLQTSNP